MQKDPENAKNIKKQRLRRILFDAIFVLGLLLLIYGINESRDIRGFPHKLALILGILIAIIGYVGKMVVWRCPACRSYLGRGIALQFCPSCGLRLSSDPIPASTATPHVRFVLGGFFASIITIAINYSMFSSSRWFLKWVNALGGGMHGSIVLCLIGILATTVVIYIATLLLYNSRKAPG